MKIAPGDRGPAFAFGPLTRTDIVRYAGAAQDFNRIHHDEPFAIASGFPSTFAHGMQSAGILAAFLTRWFGPNRVRRYRVRFREVVYPGDLLTAEGTVLRVYEEEGERRAEVEIALLRQTGNPAVAGTAEVALPAD
jgi:acyl dehydratase